MSDDKNKKSPLRSYAEYSALGMEMVAVVLVCVFLGVKLDDWVPLKFPLFTLFFTQGKGVRHDVELVRRERFVPQVVEAQHPE